MFDVQLPRVHSDSIVEEAAQRQASPAGAPELPAPIGCRPC